MTGIGTAHAGANESLEDRRHAAVRRLALARLHRIAHSGDGRALRTFHARYKYLLMAADAARARSLGRIAAAAPRAAADSAFAAYERELRAALAAPPARGAQANALLHMFGYVSRMLTPDERAGFTTLLDHYLAGDEPLDAPATRLHEWIARADVAYLRAQYYFESFRHAR